MVLEVKDWSVVCHFPGDVSVYSQYFLFSQEAPSGSPTPWTTTLRLWTTTLRLKEKQVAKTGDQSEWRWDLEISLLFLPSLQRLLSGWGGRPVVGFCCKLLWEPICSRAIKPSWDTDEIVQLFLPAAQTSIILRYCKISKKKLELVPGRQTFM